MSRSMERPGFPSGACSACACTSNGTPDAAGGRGHVISNVDFSANVINADGTETFSLFDFRSTGLWTG